MYTDRKYTIAKISSNTRKLTKLTNNNRRLDGTRDKQLRRRKNHKTMIEIQAREMYGKDRKLEVKPILEKFQCI
jgi:hypothetical protein